MPLSEVVVKIGKLSEVSTENFKYHVDYIGMTSFDRAIDTFILIKNENEEERLIWMSEVQETGELKLYPGEFEAVLGEFIAKFEKMRADLPPDS